jgi:hypothetical protein
LFADFVGNFTVDSFTNSKLNSADYRIVKIIESQQNETENDERAMTIKVDFIKKLRGVFLLYDVIIPKTDNALPHKTMCK